MLLIKYNRFVKFDILGVYFRIHKYILDLLPQSEFFFKTLTNGINYACLRC